MLCRRARERREPPDLTLILEVAKRWVREDAFRWVAAEAGVHFEDVLGVVEETAGRLNFNDGLLVVLQRLALIDDVASLDIGFDVVADFRRIGVGQPTSG